MKILTDTLKKVHSKSFFNNLIMVSVCVLAVSCEKSEFQDFDNELGQIHVSDTRIILTPKHISGIKSERYQPSLTLYGYLIPMQQTLITSPQRIKIMEILVSNNQAVKKDQPLVKYLVAPRLQSTNVQTIPLQDTQLPNTQPQTTTQPPKNVKMQNLQTEDLQPDSLQSGHKQPNDIQIEDVQTKNVNTKDVQTNNLQTTETFTADEMPPLQSLKPRQTLEQNQTIEQSKELREASGMLTLQPYEVISPSQQSILSIKAPFTGILQHIYYKQEQVFNNFMPTIVEKKQPILVLRSKDDWQFISIVPKNTESKLSIGQHVNFAVLVPHDRSNMQENYVDNKQTSTSLTGQISAITPMDNGSDIEINIHVLPDKNRLFQLKSGMKVQGKVNYGQIEVGTLVDKAGVHEIRDHHIYSHLETDLSVFTKTNANVVAPVKAFVWIVGQDRKLKRQIVDVIRYQQTGQYLVAGIPNDVLICLISLPKSMEGRIVKIS